MKLSCSRPDSTQQTGCPEQKKDDHLRIAMLAPISWRTPPRHYGPWEQVTSLLTEALVARDIDVTLFATRDSRTAGKLDGICPAPYSEDPTIDAKVGDAPRRPCLRAGREVRPHSQSGRFFTARLLASG
jgi:hypothetical protein